MGNYLGYRHTAPCIDALSKSTVLRNADRSSQWACPFSVIIYLTQFVDRHRGALPE